LGIGENPDFFRAGPPPGAVGVVIEVAHFVDGIFAPGFRVESALGFDGRAVGIAVPPLLKWQRPSDFLPAG
jgi:hypothetical protein